MLYKNINNKLILTTCGHIYCDNCYKYSYSYKHKNFHCKICNICNEYLHDVNAKLSILIKKFNKRFWDQLKCC